MEVTLISIAVTCFVAVCAVDVHISPDTTVHLPSHGYPTTDETWNCACGPGGNYRVEMRFEKPFSLMDGDSIGVENDGLFQGEQYTFLQTFSMKALPPDHIRSYNNTLNVLFHKGTGSPTQANHWSAILFCVETELETYFTVLGSEEGAVSWDSTDIPDTGKDYVNVLFFQSDGLLKEVFDETFLYMEFLLLNTNNSLGIYTIDAGKTDAKNVRSYTNVISSIPYLIPVSAPIVALVITYDNYNNGSKSIDLIRFKYVRTGEKLNHLSRDNRGSITLDTCRYGQVGQPDSGSVAYSCNYYIYSSNQSERVLVTPKDYQIPPGTTITIRDGWVDSLESNLLARFGLTDNAQSKDRPVLSFSNMLVVSVEGNLVKASTSLSMDYQIVDSNEWKDKEICKSPTVSGSSGLMVSCDYYETVKSQGGSYQFQMSFPIDTFLRFTVLRYYGSGSLSVDFNGAIQKAYTASNYISWPETFSTCIGPINLNYAEPDKGKSYESFELIWEHVPKDNSTKNCSSNTFLLPGDRVLDKSQNFPCFTVSKCTQTYSTNASHVFQISLLENLVQHPTESLKVTDASGNVVLLVTDGTKSANDLFHSKTNQISVFYSGSKFQFGPTAGYRMLIRSVLAEEVIITHTQSTIPSTAKSASMSSSKSTPTKATPTTSSRAPPMVPQRRIAAIVLSSLTLVIRSML